MTDADTLAQRKVLAKRFPWAQGKCRYCSDDNPCRDMHPPLPPNDMLAAVLRECYRRDWEIHRDGQTVVHRIVTRRGEFHGSSFIAAFLAATEGEAPITERSLAEAGSSGPLTEEEPMPEKPITPSGIKAPVGAHEGLCPRGCGPMRVIYRAVIKECGGQLVELKELRCPTCNYGETR